MFFRPSCPVGHRSPQCGCPSVTLISGITVLCSAPSSYEKIKLPSFQTLVAQLYFLVLSGY